MIVYHGSNTVVQHPDVIHTCRNLDFGEDLDSWIDFVCDCRDGGEQYLQYDVIIGKVYPTYDQIAFVTQDAIN